LWVYVSVALYKGATEIETIICWCSVQQINEQNSAGIVSIGIVLGSTNLVIKNVRHCQFLNQTGLKQILETLLHRDFLSLADMVEDLPEVAH